MAFMTSTRTSTSYETNIEKRGGKQVAVIVRTTTVTPVSGRGTEWSKAEIHSETTVLPVEEAKDMLESITSAFYFALDGIVEKEVEPLVLTHLDGGVLSPHWSVTEAEERARALQAQYSTPDFDKLVIAWAADTGRDGHVVSVIERTQA